MSHSCCITGTSYMLHKYCLHKLTCLYIVTVQETGETLTGAVRSLAEALATARQQSPDSLQELLGPKDHKRMFLSLGGRYMLTYSLDTAMMLHNVPLIFTLTAPWTLRLMNPALVRHRGSRVVLGAPLHPDNWCDHITAAVFHTCMPREASVSDGYICGFLCALFASSSDCASPFGSSTAL